MKTRRKATKAEMLRESKDHPGYYKYKVTIEEVDGTTSEVPAYGKDMQDAISRLVWTERVDKVTSKKGVMPIFAALLLSVVALSGMIAVTKNNPIWILGGLVIGILSLVLANLVNTYLQKK